MAKIKKVNKFFVFLIPKVIISMIRLQHHKSKRQEKKHDKHTVPSELTKYCFPHFNDIILIRKRFVASESSKFKSERILVLKNNVTKSLKS